MDGLQRVLRVLTLVTAGLFVLIFPYMLFAVQGFGAFDLEMSLTLVSLYLLHPAAIILILLASFGKIATVPWQFATTVVLAVNIVVLFAMAAVIRAGAVTGDWFPPVVFTVPSVLFLANRSIGFFRSL